MKRCPECRRDYYDDSLIYCLDDGTALLEGPASGDESATAILHGLESPAEAKTRDQIPAKEQTDPLPENGNAASKRKFSPWILAAPLILAAIVAGGFFAYRYFNPSTSGQINSIAVLPFQNRNSDADGEYLSDGLAESLIYRLSQFPELKVAPPSSAFRYKGQDVDAEKVGIELGVDAVMSGRLVQRGENLTISVDLVDVRNKRTLWGEQFERKMSDLLATQREIATAIAQKLHVKLTTDSTGITKKYTNSNESYQLYLKGRFHWNKRNEQDMQRSIEYFQQTIEQDPNFALAYSGLADAYDLLGVSDAIGGLPPNEAMPKAKAAALKALEIDDTLAEAHVSLAHVNYYYDRDWATTEREYRRAIELNPNYPIAHQWYSMYLMSASRFGEALAEARRAQELDPLSLPINMTLGWVLLTARQNDQSVEQLRKTLELDPNFILAHHRLGMVYVQQGKYQDAIAEFQRIVELAPRMPLGLAALGHTYAAAGRRVDAEKALGELLELAKQRYVSPASIAAIYGALGDRDQAFAWLDKADQAHDGILVRLKVDYRFDSLRSDPRFGKLLMRVNLAE